MSEDNHYGAHPVATVPSHYSIQGPQHSGIQAGPPPQIPTNQSYGYREEASQYHYNMNGVAGGSQQNHAPQIYPYQMASAPRAPPPPSSQWPSYNSNNYHAPDERRGPPIDHIQSNTASYSPAEPTWNKIRPQHSASDQNYSHPHNMGGHSSANYGYSRPSHLPLEPIAAPSPPRTYPNSPRTPLPPHPSSNQNGIPAQSFRSHTVSRGPLVVSIASPMENAAIHRPEPSSSHGSTYGESSRSSPATQSLLSRQQGRHNMVSPLGPPPSALGNFEGGPHRPYAQNRGSESYSRGPVENSVKLERRGSSPKPARNSYAPQPDYDSMDDSRRIKQERSSREPSPDVSPGASRADRPDDRSPSYTGSVNRDSKGNILEALPKKRGAPVFTDGNGQEYYENEVVPPGVALPHGWQLGVGKLTKGLLLPCHKDGIQVNPEWGFTAGGKARQRLPQACKNCRAKKIRCVESDHSELICQHCSKMRIPCQRHEKEDEKRKKPRGSISQEYIKSENGDGNRSGSILSDKGESKSPLKSGPRKRKSSDESPNGNKRLYRGDDSRSGSISRDSGRSYGNPVNQSVQVQTQMIKTQGEDVKPSLFPRPEDATATTIGDPRSRTMLIRQLREDNRSADIHGRSHSMTDNSPQSSYNSMSPRTTPASNMYSGGYAEGHSHDYPGSRLSSTPAGSPPIPFSQLNLRLLGGDERHPDLPQRSDLIHLMEAYFDNVYSQTYAFLHRDTFMRNLDKHKPVLLFSMCAVAARFAGLRNRLHDHHKAEEIFETRARELIMKDYDKYSLEMVQSLVHMGLHDFGSNNGQKAWMFAGMAVRMGAALNMNLETNRKKEKDAITRESIRRTYWSYYLMDRFNSYGVARPYLTQDHDCHVQLPCNQPSFHDGKSVITEHLLGPNPYSPKHGTKYMGAMAYLVRIGSIWGDILKQIHLSAFQEKTGLPTNEFSQFVKRLEKWRIELPPGLEYSNENLAGQIEVGTTGAFVVMHVMWHTAMAYVYRYVRTVGGAKEYIEKNIPRKEVVESIRKAFVHADAVLQIMCHVRIRRDLARESNGKPVTVNAPFLGQAIYDACSIAAIRAQEVKDTESAAQQKARIKVGVSWLRELKRWWKPIQGLHKKLNAIYNNLDRGTSRQAQIAVPTPESVTDTALQPGSQFNPVDPENYTDPSSYPGAGVDASRTSFHVYHDYMAVNFSDPSYFNEALGGPGSMNAISDYAVLEGGFAELYLPFETDTGISAPFDNQIQAPTAFAMGQGIADLMQIDLPTNPEELGYVMEEPDLSRVYEESEDEDGSGSPSADETAEDPNINTVYFDTNAVREGNLQETSSETSSRSRRSSDAAAPTKHEGNPMDVLNLINNDQEMQDEVKTSLQKGMGQDKFTGPDGEAAPGNTEMGGKPSMENMDNDQWGATKQRCM